MPSRPQASGPSTPTSGPPLRLSFTPRREISRSQEAGGRRWTVSFRAVAIWEEVGGRGPQGPARVSFSPLGATFHITDEDSALTLEDRNWWSQPLLGLRPSSPPVCTKPATPFCSSRHDHGPPALASSVSIPVGWMGVLGNRAILVLCCFPTRPQDQQTGRLTKRLPSERASEQTTPRKGCVRVGLDLQTKGRRTAGRVELGGRWGPYFRRPSCKGRAGGRARRVPLRV